MLTKSAISLELAPLPGPIFPRVLPSRFTVSVHYVELIELVWTNVILIPRGSPGQTVNGRGSSPSFAGRMLPSLTIPKGIRTWWLLIGAAVFLLIMGFCLLKRPLLGQPPYSLPYENSRAGTTALGNSEPLPPILHVNSIVQHGRIVEIEGTTDPGAVVMINGQPAVTIFDRNEFRHFVGPLPAGTSIVTITSQNNRGGVDTQQIAVTVE